MTRTEAFAAIHDAARELGSRDLSLRICDAARAAEKESIHIELELRRRVSDLVILLDELQANYDEAISRAETAHTRADYDAALQDIQSLKAERLETIDRARAAEKKAEQLTNQLLQIGCHQLRAIATRGPVEEATP